MKKIVGLLFLLSLNFSLVHAQDKKTSLPFRVGEIVAAQIKYKEPTINNISKYEPPSTITGDSGWATVVVRLDKDRSIGIYDYVLKDKKNNIYPCIAIKEMTGSFDANKWEFGKTDPKKLYTMVFKVAKPVIGKPEFILYYNLPIDPKKDVPLKFQKVNEYTAADKIPELGIIGAADEKEIIPPKPKPEPIKLPTGKRIKHVQGKYKTDYHCSSQLTDHWAFKALDGDINTYWNPENTNKEQWMWISIPGQQNKLIKHIIIKWGNPYPKKFKLYYMDSKRADAKKTLIRDVKDNKGSISLFKDINKKMGAVLIQNMGNSSDPKNKQYRIKEIEILE